MNEFQQLTSGPPESVKFRNDNDVIWLQYGHEFGKFGSIRPRSTGLLPVNSLRTCSRQRRNLVGEVLILPADPCVC
jgi:hypothetical protein